MTPLLFGLDTQQVGEELGRDVLVLGRNDQVIELSHVQKVVVMGPSSSPIEATALADPTLVKCKSMLGVLAYSI